MTPVPIEGAGANREGSRAPGVRSPAAIAAEWSNV